PALPAEPGALQQLGRDHGRRRARLPTAADPPLPPPAAPHRRPRLRRNHARPSAAPSRRPASHTPPLHDPAPFQGATAMSRSPLTPSRRSLHAALGAGAGAAGLAACGAPGGGRARESPVREGFSQADLTVPSEYQGRTPILFWAPFTGENYEVLSTLFAEFNESQDEIVAIAESVGSYEDLNQKFTASLQARTVPDIVCFPEMQWLQFHQAGALAPLDGYF